MWVLLTEGIYSVVCVNNDFSRVMVRGRDLKSMKYFCKAMNIPIESIYKDSNRDYLYRVFVPKKIWSAFLDKEIEKMNYTNFKATVAKRRFEILPLMGSIYHSILEFFEKENSYGKEKIIHNENG